ncbi:MAG: anti-sigma factor [Magnetovibrio sp.]|nr:anti-sigma factor [Magnetovibrio sp.]
MNTPEHMSDADLNAYVDGELGYQECAEMKNWLAAQPEDAARVEAYRQQNDELHKLFDPVSDEPVPSAFSDRVVQARSNEPRPVWMQIAAMFLFLITGAAGGWGLHGVQKSAVPASVPKFVERAVGAHLVYASEVRHPVEVAASQEGHLVAWLSKRLGSPMRAPRLQSAGYQLIGGRLLEESSQPAAQFMYEDDTGRRITVYVRAHNGEATAFKFISKNNVSAFYWKDAPFAYALSGDIPRAELLKIAHVVYEDLTP